MRTRSSGASGRFVHRVGLGTMQSGWAVDEAQSYAVLDTYVEAGCDFIDTADVYSSWAADIGGPSNPGGDVRGDHRPLEPIVGANGPEQLRAAMAGLDTALAPEDVAALDEVSDFAGPGPRGRTDRSHGIMTCVRLP